MYIHCNWSSCYHGLPIIFPCRASLERWSTFNSFRLVFLLSLLVFFLLPLSLPPLLPSFFLNQRVYLFLLAASTDSVWFAGTRQLRKLLLLPLNIVVFFVLFHLSSQPDIFSFFFFLLFFATKPIPRTGNTSVYPDYPTILPIVVLSLLGLSAFIRQESNTCSPLSGRVFGFG